MYLSRVGCLKKKNTCYYSALLLRAEMAVQLDVQSVQGSPTKEIGCILKLKVKTKALPAVFAPLLFLINPKLARTSAFDSMTDESAIVNVKRNGFLHLISSVSLCE